MNRVTRQALKRIGAGAIAGGVGGGTIGHFTDKDVANSALIGAAIGGLLGAAPEALDEIFYTERNGRIRPSPFHPMSSKEFDEILKRRGRKPWRPGRYKRLKAPKVRNNA